MSMTSFWCFYCEPGTYFISFSSVSTVDLVQVNFCWERFDLNKLKAFIIFFFLFCVLFLPKKISVKSTKMKVEPKFQFALQIN